MIKKAEIKDFDDREKKGYTDLGQIVIPCADCEKDLAVIQVVKETEDTNRFKAECIFCGGESFIKTVYGKVYIDAAKSLKFDDVIVGDITIIKVLKENV